MSNIERIVEEEKIGEAWKESREGGNGEMIRGYMVDSFTDFKFIPEDVFYAMGYKFEPYAIGSASIGKNGKYDGGVYIEKEYIYCDDCGTEAFYDQQDDIYYCPMCN